VSKTATKVVCGRHHRHCHAAAEATKVVCGRHHRHCHTVAVSQTATKMVCGRHHRHCRTVATTVTRRRHHVAARAATDQLGDNGMCKSVRIHGQWVQRCHFPGQQ